MILLQLLARPLCVGIVEDAAVVEVGAAAFVVVAIVETPTLVTRRHQSSRFVTEPC